MNTFVRFFYEFISIFFDGIRMIINGIITGIIKMFNVIEYKKIIDSYKADFKIFEWILVILTIVLLVVSNLKLSNPISIIILKIRNIARLIT